MKRFIIMVSLFMTTGLGLAAEKLTVPVDFFSPSLAKLEVICQKAQATATDPSLNLLTRLARRTTDGGMADRIYSTGNTTIYLQSVSVSAYNICAARAAKLESLPTAQELKDTSSVLIGINGVAADLTMARNWRAVLALIGSDGKEIGRLTPTDSSVGTLNNWKADCSKSVCVWKGTNYYYFSPTSVIATSLKTDMKLRVLASFGQGVQQIDLPILP